MNATACPPAGRSLLGLLCGRGGTIAVAWAALLLTSAAWPALLPADDGVRAAPIALRLTVPFAASFTGVILGAAVERLWLPAGMRLLPGAWSRLVRLAVALGAATALLPWAIAVGHLGGMHGIEGIGAAPGQRLAALLATWGNVGAGFVSIFLLRQTGGWWRMPLLVLLALLWLPFGFDGPVVAAITGHLDAPWDVYHPATVTALLLGPHTWPWWLAPPAVAPRPPEARDRRRRGEAERAGDWGNAWPARGIDAWLSQAAMPLWRALGGRRVSWLMLPRGWAAAVWLPPTALCVVVAGAVLGRLPGQAVAVALLASATSASALGTPMAPGCIGRAMLLPGMPTRAAMLRALVLRHLALSAVVAALFWGPALLAAWQVGAPARQVGTAAVTLAWAVVCGTAWQAHALALRATPGCLPALARAAVVAIVLSLLAAPALWLLDAPAAWRWGALAVVAAWPPLLLADARRRWPNATFDRT